MNGTGFCLMMHSSDIKNIIPPICRAAVSVTLLTSPSFRDQLLQSWGSFITERMRLWGRYYTDEHEEFSFVVSISWPKYWEPLPQIPKASVRVRNFKRPGATAFERFVTYPFCILLLAYTDLNFSSSRPTFKIDFYFLKCHRIAPPSDNNHMDTKAIHKNFIAPSCTLEYSWVSNGRLEYVYTAEATYFSTEILVEYFNIVHEFMFPTNYTFSWKLKCICYRALD